MFFFFFHRYNMGRHRYPAAQWENISRRLYKSTYWESRCSYINQPERFSNTHYLLIAITMIWIFRRKIKTPSTLFYGTINRRNISNTVEFLLLNWSSWKNSINILKEILSRTTSLKQKLLLLCGDVEANPGPYNTGKF